MSTSKGKHRRSVADENAEDNECSSSSLPPQAHKRARFSSDSAEQVPRFRYAQQVLRPGLPTASRLSEFKLADKPSPPLRGDDKEGHYVYELGENISSRYKILSKFGEGTFGRVLECWDRKYKDYVAVKVIRNVDKYRHAAMIELEVLNMLEKNDPNCTRNCVKLKEWFNYRGHVCMVFEKLGPSLYDFLRRNEYQAFPLALVQYVARQMLEAVAYMHEVGLVHTDLKPENILLVAQDHMKLPPVAPATVERRVPRDSTIRVIDFGSATFDDGYHSSIISTRHYRAPEVILGLGWSYPCDLWSCGCIMVELTVGDALFQTHENLEHLAMMQQVLGTIPESMSSRADKHSMKYFTTTATPAGAVQHKLAWPEGATRKSLRAVQRLSDLRQLLLLRADQSVAGAAQAVEALAGLVEGLLRYEPNARTSAVQALQHEFFRLQLDMPVGEGPTPEPSAGTAAAAATMAALPMQQYHQQQQFPQQSGVFGLQMQGYQLLQQQQGYQDQQQQQQQQLYPQPSLVKGVSGDVAAEAVAARAARQAAAAAVGSAVAGLAAAAAAAASGGSGGGGVNSSDWGSGVGVEQLLVQQRHIERQQQYEQQWHLQQQQWAAAQQQQQLHAQQHPVRAAAAIEEDSGDAAAGQQQDMPDTIDLTGD